MALAFSAVVQPGPLQAFLLARVASIGWRRTLPAAFAPLLSDGPIALIALFLLVRLPPIYLEVLRIIGGGLLLYFAWIAYGGWKNPSDPSDPIAAPRTFFEAVLVNLLNPNPYLGWSLIMGPAVLSAWREHSSHALALIAGFYGTMVIGLAAFIALAGTATRFGSRTKERVLLASIWILAALGLFLVLTGILRATS